MSEPGLKVLILGGYGTFGGRLAQLLADEARLTLIIAGRSRAKAEEFCAKLAAAATLQPVAFDRDGDVEAQLRAIAPDLVVDATGPFQSYGADPYRVVRAALALGIDYLDLSDGADFVQGIVQFDAEARRAACSCCSGVSSFPVLTAAVVRRLARGPGARRDRHRRDRAVALCQCRHQRHPCDRELCRQAGRGVARRRAGSRPTRSSTRVASRSRRRVGCRSIAIRFSLVDVPDLQVLPELWPEPALGLDGRRTGAGDLASRAQCVGVAGAAADSAFAVAVRGADVSHDAMRSPGANIAAACSSRSRGSAADGTQVERSWHMTRRRRRRAVHPVDGRRGDHPP